MTNIKQKGIFISIDSLDESATSTQINILSEKLKKIGHDIKTISFPQYGEKSTEIAREFLNGKHEHADKIESYASSIFYASNRFTAKKKIEAWLQNGKIVISNRYISTNFGPQSGKIFNNKEREEFYICLYNFEYDVLKIPKPDINILLGVESNMDPFKKETVTYSEPTDIFNDSIFIDCSLNVSTLNTEATSEKIWEALSPYLNKKSNYSPDFNQLHNENTNELSSVLKVEKIFDNAKLPTRNYNDDAGLDLHTVESKTIYPGQRFIIRTGIKIAIPKGYVGLIWDKSGIAKSGLKTMGGVIDAGFRGEITINISNVGDDMYNLEIGQKVAQLLIQKIEYPLVVETKIDDETNRGKNDYGSSGIF